MEENEKGEVPAGGGQTGTSKMTLARAVEMGEYHPEYLSTKRGTQKRGRTIEEGKRRQRENIGGVFSGLERFALSVERCSPSKGIKIILPLLDRLLVLVFAEEKVEPKFAGSRDFLESWVVGVRVQCKVEEFKSPSVGKVGVFRISLLFPFDGSFDFTADVGHLLYQRKFGPATLVQVGVLHII